MDEDILGIDSYLSDLLAGKDVSNTETDEDIHNYTAEAELNERLERGPFVYSNCSPHPIFTLQETLHKMSYP